MLVKRFEEIHREKKESLLLISHQEKIIRMADRIMVVKDGKIADEGSREEMIPKLFADGERKGDEGCGAECCSR